MLCARCAQIWQLVEDVDLVDLGILEESPCDCPKSLLNTWNDQSHSTSCKTIAQQYASVGSPCFSFDMSLVRFC